MSEHAGNKGATGARRKQGWQYVLKGNVFVV